MSTQLQPYWLLSQAPPPEALMMPERCLFSLFLQEVDPQAALSATGLRRGGDGRPRHCERCETL